MSKTYYQIKEINEERLASFEKIEIKDSKYHFQQNINQYMVYAINNECDKINIGIFFNIEMAYNLKKELEQKMNAVKKAKSSGRVMYEEYWSYSVKCIGDQRYSYNVYNPDGYVFDFRYDDGTASSRQQAERIAKDIIDMRLEGEI